MACYAKMEEKKNYGLQNLFISFQSVPFVKKEGGYDGADEIKHVNVNNALA